MPLFVITTHQCHLQAGGFPEFQIYTRWTNSGGLTLWRQETRTGPHKFWLTRRRVVLCSCSTLAQQIMNQTFCSYFVNLTTHSRLTIHRSRRLDVFPWFTCAAGSVHQTLANSPCAQNYLTKAFRCEQPGLRFQEPTDRLSRSCIASQPCKLSPFWEAHSTLDSLSMKHFQQVELCDDLVTPSVNLNPKRRHRRFLGFSLTGNKTNWDENGFSFIHCQNFNSSEHNLSPCINLSAAKKVKTCIRSVCFRQKDCRGQDTKNIAWTLVGCKMFGSETAWTSGGDEADQQVPMESGTRADQ